MADTILCTIKEEKFNINLVDNNQDIKVTIQGGGVIENFAELISQYKIMLKTIYDIDENGIVDYAEAIKSGNNVLTYLALKNTIDKAHEHANKTLLDSIRYDSDYRAFLIEG